MLRARPSGPVPLALGLIAAALTLACGADAPPASAPAVATPLPSVHVHQLFQAATNVFSGDSPDGDEDFAEIAKLGVKVLISVDGARPELERARRHGLRYVHLPFGYDEVPPARVAELVQAARTAGGPIYIHCHHGKHRGPAAVAIVCQATAGWTTNQAVRWLRQAGTADDYPGLYRSAIEFKPPEAGTLARLASLPEVAVTSSLVEAMVAIDREFDRLKAARKAGWNPVPGQPDLVPARTAAILRDHLRDLARLEDTRRRPSGYAALLAASEQATAELIGALQDPAGGRAARDAAFETLSRSCVDCHRRHRN